MPLSEAQFPNVNSKMEAWKYSKVESYLRLKHEDHENDQLDDSFVIPEEVKSLMLSGAETKLFYNGQLVFDKTVMTAPRQNHIHLYGNRFEGITKASRIKNQSEINISGGANVKIFEAHIALNDLEFSLENNIQINVSENSRLERLKCFWLGDDSYVYDLEQVSVSDSAHFKNLLIQMGGKWSRLEQHAQLHSEHSSFYTLGAYLLGGSGHCDLTTSIDHIVGHTQSEQLFKGLVTDSSRAAFTGRILIRQDAQKSSTAQLNQNVVLGDKAEADSRPQLEVYADDVTASHGTTIGGLNEDEIFYLQSRGLSKVLSIELVAKAFVNDLAERLDCEDLKKSSYKILERGFSRYIQSALENM